MRIPLNRLVAFLGPTISAVCAAVAAWLVAKLNVLGLPGLDEANLATYLAALVTAGLTAGLSHLGQAKWLQGHHILLAAQSPVVPLDGDDQVHELADGDPAPERP